MTYLLFLYSIISLIFYIFQFPKADISNLLQNYGELVLNLSYFLSSIMVVVFITDFDNNCIQSGISDFVNDFKECGEVLC